MVRLAMAIMITCGLVAGAAHAQPFDSFRLKPGAIICPRSTSLAEAYAANRTGDSDWFDETGCIKSPENYLVALINAPWSPKFSDNLIWHFRAYDAQKKSLGNFYASEYEIVTYGRVGVFNSAAEASATYDAIRKLVGTRQETPIPMSVIEPREGKFHLWIGPDSYKSIFMTCHHLFSATWDDRSMKRRPGAPSCETAVSIPR